MKVLFTTNPGVGHLFPMLPIAHAMQQRGHQIAFATARSFGAAVAAHGFEVHPAGLDWLESQAAQRFPELDDMTVEQQGEWLLTDVFADVAAHEMLPDLLALCRTWQPDLIVRNDFEFAACLAAELLGIPQATISISFFLSTAALEPLIGEQLAYLRSRYGLRPYPALDMLYPSLYLVLAPATFQPRELPVMHAIQPIPLRTPTTTLPHWWHEMPPQPTVYASLSSVYRGANVFPAILAGLRDEPINLVLTIGQEQDPAQFGPQPPNVHIERFIPQAAVFPACDLFITHCPFFTMLSALSHAVPLLMIPNGGELRLGALRANELGLGRVLRLPGQAAFFDKWVPEMSPQTITSAVRDLLHDPRYRVQAQQMRAEIMALPGPDHAVDLLEQLARDGVPLLNAAAQPMFS